MADEINITPRSNSFLLGQSKAEELFLKAWKNNTMHHAWILNGPKGIGKATLVYRIARFLLWADESKKEAYNSLNVPEDSEVFRQVASGSHPDLMAVRRRRRRRTRWRAASRYSTRPAESGSPSGLLPPR